MLFADSVVQGITSSLPPWRDPVCSTRLKPWPINVRTGRPYSGRNALSLLFQGQKSPLWGTRKTWEAIGATVRADAVPVPIQVLIPTGFQKRFCRQFLLFGESQVEGGRRPGPKKVDDGIGLVRRMLMNGSVKVVHALDRPHYNIQGDYISMPPIETMDGEASYYRLLLHELGHWTGHADRLRRKFGKTFACEEYAREELVAELTSMQVGATINLQGACGDQDQQHLAYVSMWWKLIPANNIKLIREACKDVGRATRFLLDLIKERE